MAAAAPGAAVQKRGMQSNAKWVLSRLRRDGEGQQQPRHAFATHTGKVSSLFKNQDEIQVGPGSVPSVHLWLHFF